MCGGTPDRMHACSLAMQTRPVPRSHAACRGPASGEGAPHMVIWSASVGSVTFCAPRLLEMRLLG